MWLTVSAWSLCICWSSVYIVNTWNLEESSFQVHPYDVEPVQESYKDKPQSMAVPTIVLTMDVSETMEYKNRIQNLNSAVHQWIYSIPDGVLLGMVKFSTEEELLSDLTLVSKTTRKQLVQSIPVSGQGETCIGCGVRLALQVFGRRKGVIVLITDGQNTEPGQFITDVQNEVIASGIKVVAVGFGDIAPLDDLSQLANVTGGLFFSVPDEDSVQNLLVALQESLKMAMAQEDISLPTTSESLTTLVNEDNSVIGAGTTHMTFKKKGVTNKTTSHKPVGRQHSISAIWWLIIVSAVVGGLLLLVLLVLLVWRRFIATRITGFYPVAQSEAQNKA